MRDDAPQSGPPLGHFGPEVEDPFLVQQNKMLRLDRFNRAQTFYLPCKAEYLAMNC